MSNETYETLEQAIRDHLKSERPGGFLTDWALITVSATDSHDRTSYYTEYSESPHHGMLGLAQMLHQDVVRQGGWAE